jgi:hypothetical protein
VTGLFCHRHPRNYCPTNLTPASGCQDHTSLPSAFVPFVNGTISVHRIPSRVRDDREAPLEWDETVMDIRVIWVSREQNSFCRQDWTGEISLIPKENFFSTVIPDYACESQK